MSIQEKIKKFYENLKNTIHNAPLCRLVLVTKTHPLSTLQAAYEAGCRDFGENKVQEMVDKYKALPKDIRWHQIGHLQTNKVKYIAPFVSLIHSVDSLKLLQEINKQAQKHGRVIDCLLQIHIAQEETKFGLTQAEAEALLASPQVAELRHIQILGLMGMATLTESEVQIRQEFAQLQTFFQYLQQKPMPPNVSLKELSMGMSQDYHLALQYQSTMIRVGSAILGNR